MARTRVTVYGDAAQYMTQQRIINDLRGSGAWRYAHVHFFQRAGRLMWDFRAPIGYDNARSKPRVQVKPQPGRKTPRGGIPFSVDRATLARITAGGFGLRHDRTRGAGGTYGIGGTGHR